MRSERPITPTAARRDGSPAARWPAGGRGQGRADGVRDTGYVTAETAVVLPALILLMAMLIWGGLAVAAQLRCIDAARVGARAAARGDGNAVALAQAMAPAGAAVRLATDGATVRVLVEAECLGPGRLASALSVRVTGDATAAREDLAGKGFR